MQFTVEVAMTDPTHCTALARTAEECGFAQVAVPDSSFWSEQVSDAYPYTADGGRMWNEDTPFAEPFMAVAVIAAVTEQIRFCTHVIKVGVRNPLMLAKQVSTATVLSRNRFTFGAGVGWLKEEFEWCGQAYEGRDKRVDKSLDAVLQVLSGEWTSYDGEHVGFGRLKMPPAPTERVPVYIGRHTPLALRRTARFGDGWTSATIGYDDFRAVRAELTGMLEASRRPAGGFAFQVASSDRYGLDGYKELEAAGLQRRADGRRAGGQEGRTAPVRRRHPGEVVTETSTDVHPDIHSARLASQRSMAAVKAQDRAGWLALWAEDGCVEDPVGVSWLDPTGEGHRGKEAIGRFFDRTIATLEGIRFDITDSFAAGSKVANVGTIHLSLPGGTTGRCEGVFVYRVDKAGLLVSLPRLLGDRPDERDVHHRMSDLDVLARAFAQLASDAGRLMMEVYATDFEVRTKGDLSPVSEADERAEALLVPGVQALLPGVTVVAEEAVSCGEMPDVAGEFILIYPVDGTRKFVSHNGDFTVNVALVRDGVPVAGVVYAPAKQRLFVGCTSASTGALVAGELVGSLEPIATRPYPAGGLVAVASRSHLDERTQVFLDGLQPADRRSAGSSLKFCLVAAGEADVYPRFGPTMEWDTAAGDAVLRAAGGTVVDEDGAVLRYGKVESGLRNGPFVCWGQEPLL